MTPAQQIAIARIIQDAAALALAVTHAKSWNVVNGVIDNEDLQTALANPKGLARRFVADRQFKLAQSLAFFFSEAELIAMAQPSDPQGCEL